jgi:hypothetical protein
MRRIPRNSGMKNPAIAGALSKCNQHNSEKLFNENPECQTKNLLEDKSSRRFLYQSYLPNSTLNTPGVLFVMSELGPEMQIQVLPGCNSMIFLLAS